MDELQAFGELMVMLVTHPLTGVLIVLVSIAAFIDVRTMRIPNWLTVPGMLFGLTANASYASSMTAGLTHSALGLLAGLLLLMPLYGIRVIGAGDVKLLAMVGAFLGLTATLKASIFILVVGGIAAFCYAILHRATARLLSNMRDIAYSAAIRGVPLWRPGTGGVSIGNLPYGVSIAAGTIVFLVSRQLDFI